MLAYPHPQSSDQLHHHYPLPCSSLLRWFLGPLDAWLFGTAFLAALLFALAFGPAFLVALTLSFSLGLSFAPFAFRLWLLPWACKQPWLLPAWPLPTCTFRETTKWTLNPADENLPQLFNLHELTSWPNVPSCFLNPCENSKGLTAQDFITCRADNFLSWKFPGFGFRAWWWRLEKQGCESQVQQLPVSGWLGIQHISTGSGMFRFRDGWGFSWFRNDRIKVVVLPNCHHFQTFMIPAQWILISWHWSLAIRLLYTTLFTSTQLTRWNVRVWATNCFPLTNPLPGVAWKGSVSRLSLSTPFSKGTPPPGRPVT